MKKLLACIILVSVMLSACVAASAKQQIFAEVAASVA